MRAGHGRPGEGSSFRLRHFRHFARDVLWATLPVNGARGEAIMLTIPCRGATEPRFATSRSVGSAMGGGNHARPDRADLPAFPTGQSPAVDLRGAYAQACATARALRASF